MFSDKVTRSMLVTGIVVMLLAGASVAAMYHSADTNTDQQISLSELLRVIQFYNSGGYHTECGTEDDFTPGPGPIYDCGSEGEGEEEGEMTIMLPGAVSLEMVWIPGGAFMMGRFPGEQDSYAYEEPRHAVTVSGFWMGRYEVTQAQWVAIMGSNPSFLSGVNRPVEQVSWDDAKSFITALNSHTGMTFRLPSEAEWEYACRADTMTRFYWGDDLTYTAIGDYAWYSGNSGGQTHERGEKLPNPWGLYDISGNVWEWCEDDLHDSYTGAPTDGTAWIDEPRGVDRVARGGSWDTGGSGCRSAARTGGGPSAASNYIGLRLAR